MICFQILEFVVKLQLFVLGSEEGEIHLVFLNLPFCHFSRTVAFGQIKFGRHVSAGGSGTQLLVGDVDGTHRASGILAGVRQ